MIYTKEQLLGKLAWLGANHEKVVDAVLWNQAQSTIRELNILEVQQEDILRQLEAKREALREEVKKKFMTEHQGDNMEDSNRSDDHDCHLSPDDGCACVFTTAGPIR